MNEILELSTKLPKYRAHTHYIGGNGSAYKTRIE